MVLRLMLTGGFVFLQVFYGGMEGLQKLAKCGPIEML
jgi:hypothetical protein